MPTRLLLFILLSLSSSASWTVEMNQQALDFTLPSSKNAEISLHDFKGKTIILEWLNHGCPFVKKHYNSQNMQNAQKMAKEKGYIWLSIISSAKGKQGHSTAEQALKDAKEKNSLAFDILLDEEGKVGKLYEAVSTPQIVLIDKNGNIRYYGAIDDRPTTDLSDIQGARNYLLEAMQAIEKKQKVKVAKTKPYGCSVKY